MSREEAKHKSIMQIIGFTIAIVLLIALVTREYDALEYVLYIIPVLHSNVDDIFDRNRRLAIVSIAVVGVAILAIALIFVNYMIPFAAAEYILRILFTVEPISYFIRALVYANLAH